MRDMKGVTWTLGIETFLCPRSAVPIEINTRKLLETDRRGVSCSRRIQPATHGGGISQPAMAMRRNQPAGHCGRISQPATSAESASQPLRRNQPASRCGGIRQPAAALRRNQPGSQPLRRNQPASNCSGIRQPATALASQSLRMAESAHSGGIRQPGGQPLRRN